MVAKANKTNDAQASSPISAQRAFSIEEFCRRYGVGRTKVYEELKLGRLRALKVGRRTIISKDDAENWLLHLPLMKTTNSYGEVVS
jgi:excisionase family DNA binding protein